MACRSDVFVAADPHAVYAIVSDLPRSGRWSPECRGGEWVSGAPGGVGSVFAGRNHRADDVVAWAPVVRGDWETRAQVVQADPGEVFAWAMADSAGRPQESVWSFRLAPAEGGCVLTHAFRMGAPTEGIAHITSEMDDAERKRFFAEWSEKVGADLAAAAVAVKEIAESPS